MSSQERVIGTNRKYTGIKVVSALDRIKLATTAPGEWIWLLTRPCAVRVRGGKLNSVSFSDRLKVGRKTLTLAMLVRIQLGDPS